MQRYFLEENIRNDDQISISGDDFHHIVRVMRMAIGDKLAVVFPDGKAACCEIVQIHHDHVQVSVIEWEARNRELPIQVGIGMSLLKGDKLDLVIQKGTELGAQSFYPFSSERSIVKLDHKKADKKTERWQKIAKEAAEQSERNRIPTVEEPCSINEIIKKSSRFTKKIVAYEENARNNDTSSFYETLRKLSKGDSLFIMFGPEGGFSANEIQLLEEHEFVVCGLGPRILRAETAPLYSLASISFYFELQG